MLYRLCFTAALALLMGIGEAVASPQASRWGAGYLPNPTLVTQHGRPLRFYDDVLKGKISVISFIYTSCRDNCPVVTARLSQLEEKLGEAVGRDIFFVSISIDPVTDTSDKLKSYAEAFQAGPDWLFLTGKAEDIDLIRFKLGERSKKIVEHRNEVMLYNDATGEWQRDSAFSDLNSLAMTVRAMDPSWRSSSDAAESAKPEVARSEAPLRPPTDLPGQALFTKTCAACHTVGRGDKVGPDLKGVGTRHSRDWISSYIQTPDKMRSEKDPAAMALAARFPTVRMPNLQLSKDDAADVMAYIEAMSYAADARAKAQASGKGDAMGAQRRHHHAH